MIVFDRKEKEIKVPEGLGNINLTVVDANLEDRTVEINEVETTILPSSGYNGMSSLQIDAQPVYDNGYNEGENVGYNSGYVDGEYRGFNNGYTAGETAQKAKLTGITITENGTYSREDGYNEITVDVPDLNGDYNEGYDVGKVEGYNSGYTIGKEEGLDEGYQDGLERGYQNGFDNGIIEQKKLLTNITITENGTYTREDGYNNVVVDVPDTNGSYDEGYQAGIEYAAGNAEEIAAANAIDLVATEFGTYYTKYSDNIDIVYPDLVTGIYPNGENFYDYVNLENRVYNTGIIPTKDTKIEFWYRDLFNVSSKFGIIIGSGKEDNDNCYEMKKEKSAFNSYFYRWGNRSQFYDIYNQGEWNNYIISYQDGVVVNGVKITDVGYPTYNGNSPFYINGAEYSTTYNNNGYFGMIKITTEGITNVIIPTKDGFKNITTGEMLEMVNDGMYAFVNNTPNTNILNNLIKSVDVQPKIGVAKYGIKLGYCTFTEVPDFYDFEGVTDLHHMFYNCDNLQTIPLIDTSNITNMESMLEDCDNLQTIPLIDTSNVTNMKYTFNRCYKIQSVPLMDTRNVTDMYQMFGNCNELQSIPPLRADVLNTNSGLFGFSELPKLTDFGGLINLKTNMTGNYSFQRCPNLTYESCINILNGLWDFRGNGETPTSSQGKLKVHSNFLTTVGDEISIGTNKGWTITA